MSDEPYSWLACDSDFVLPPEWEELLQDIPEKHGMRVSVFYGGESLARAMAYVGPVFGDPEYGTLTLAERELIGTVVSASNGCITCTILHGHALGNLMGDHGRARRIALNYRAVPLSTRERALADYAIKLTKVPDRTEPADIETLRNAGLSDRDIYHVIETVAVFNWSNRMTSGMGLRVDDDFMEAISPPAPG